MMESILITINSAKKLSLEQVLVSFCMVFPLVLRTLVQKVLLDDLILSVVHFPSSS